MSKIHLADFKKRIKKAPVYMSWELAGGELDGYREKGEIDYEGLGDIEKLCLYVFAWNTSDICPRKKTIADELGWSKFKVAKLVKESNCIEVVTTISERTGLISGKGYFLNYKSNKK